jgi:hypothetical protein
MKEEDLNKAIGLKKILDDKRKLLKFANSCYVDLRVNLEDRFGHSSDIRDISNIFDDGVIEGLKAMAIASIEKSINDLTGRIRKIIDYGSSKCRFV